jgi:uncharacterized damage-inducible protein DinB
MSQTILNQFGMTRNFFLKKVEALPNDIVRVQPEGFNNNILWHIGHVLTVTEQFMFGFPKKTTYLPENYVELFGNGTKPADWNEENVPQLDELISQLKEQVTRLKEINVESFEQVLKKPFLGFETYGELAQMALFHEAHHLGQIHSIQRVITTESITN